MKTITIEVNETELGTSTNIYFESMRSTEVVGILETLKQKLINEINSSKVQVNQLF